MNKKTLLLIATLLAPAMSHGSWFDTLTLSAGTSEDFDTPFRIGLRGDIDTRWFDSGTGYLSGYYELALNHFTDSDRAASAISFSPVLVYHFRTAGKLEPFVELGIGVAYFDERLVGLRDLGSKFQFEDRVGVGFRHGNHDWTLRYMHYSNAGIEEPNDGIDMVMISYGHRF